MTRLPGTAPGRGLRIVATTNLNNNLMRSLAEPLVAHPAVREVVWVTDKANAPLPKVRYIVPRRLPPGNAARLLLRLPVLAWQILRTRPHLVMAYNMMPHGLVVYALGRLLGRRVAIHLIGGPDEIPGGGYRVDKRITRPNRPLEALYLAILRRTDVITVYGNATRRYLLDQGVAAARIHFMSSKVDLARFYPGPAGPRPYDLICVAALIPRKRIDLFLRVVADLKLRFPAIRAAVLGEGHLRGALEALAHDLGLAGHVEFLGFQERTEDFYHQAKIFVLTSTTEGISVAMMEAMACGLPAVVSAVGDMADLARDGVTGYLVRPPEQPGFVAALTRLLDDEASRERLGRQARHAVQEGYSLAAGTAGWRGIFAGLARPRRGPAADGR